MSFENLTDEELMILYRNGNEAAFKALYSRHSSKVYSFLKKRIKSEEKIFDMFQEVFVKIHKSKHLYDKTFQVLPWIFTITKTVMIDEIRKDKKHSLNEEINDELVSSIETYENKEKNVSTLLEYLPENQKSVMQMRYIEEKTFEEIALRLKTSPANIRKIVSRGIKRLKELTSAGDLS